MPTQKLTLSTNDQMFLHSDSHMFLEMPSIDLIGSQ